MTKNIKKAFKALKKAIKSDNDVLILTACTRLKSELQELQFMVECRVREKPLKEDIIKDLFNSGKKRAAKNQTLTKRST